MSSLKRLHSQRGSAAAGASIFLLISLLLLAVVFGVWAYQGRQDYKNNVDEKITAAIADARQGIVAEEQQKFTEQSKSPLRTWVGPESFGAIRVKYPRTWSGYVASHDDRQPYVDAYFQQGTVPDVTDQKSVFALRVRVSGNSYSTIMQQYQGSVKSGLASVTPYKLPKVKGVIGSKITGQIYGYSGKTGTVIVLPLRNNALEIWTESNQYLNDFNKYILPNLTFSP